MASGTVNGSFTGTGTGNVRPVLEWSSTSNVNNNNSSVTVTLVFMKYNNSWQSFNRNGHSATIGIDGNNSSSNRTFDIRNGSRHVIWSRTRTVGHNSDGRKSITIRASGNTGVSLGSYNFSGNISLDNIPRASDLNSFSFGGSISPSTARTISLSINRKHSSFTHNISLVAGNTTIQSWNNQGTPSSLTISASNVNSLLNIMSNSTSRQLTLRVQTRNGSSNVGSAQTRNASVSVHSNVTPNISNFNVVIGGSGVDNTINKYVQNISNPRASFNSSANGGAYLVTTNVRLQRVDGGQNYVHGGTMGQWQGGLTLNTVTGSGQYRLTAGATDSRGRTTQVSRTITVHAYSPPQINSFTASRNESTPAIVNYYRAGNWSALGGDNSLTIRVDKRNTGATSWTSIENMSGVSNSNGSFGANRTSSGNNVTQSFEFRCLVTDRFGNSAEAFQTVSTQRVVLDIHKNEGIGMGKLHERGILDVDGEAYFSPSGTEPRGGQAIIIRSNDSTGHGYIEWEDNSGNRAGYTGFASANSSHFTINNENNGNIILNGNSVVVNDRHLIQSGENSNGNWIRFYDGTQMCWNNNFYVDYENNSFLQRVWNFPANFTAVVSMQVTRENYWGPARIVRGVPSANTAGSGQTATVRLWNTGTNMQSGDNALLRTFAIGRWY